MNCAEHFVYYAANIVLNLTFHASLNIGCGTAFQPFRLCFEIFVEFLLKTSTNVFTTSKDLVDLECMDFSRCRLVQELFMCHTDIPSLCEWDRIRVLTFSFAFFLGYCSEYENCKLYSGDVV